MLTAREREIVALLAQGLNGAEAAERLSLSSETVRTHVRNAMRRSGARTRPHLIAIAAATGEIEIDGVSPGPPPAAAAPPVPAPASPSDGAMPSDQPQMIRHALETAREMLAMETAFVSDTREGRQDFVTVAGDAESFGVSAGGSVPLDGTYCQLMLAGKLENVVPDAAQEPLVAGLPITADMDIGAYIGVPIVLRDGSVYGSFACLSHEPEPLLHARDAEFMRVLARLIADLLEQDDLEAEARRSAARAERVDVLLAAIAARDGYTEEHSSEVVELALAIARRLGLEGEELARVESVALLHDIGKIGIPDAILRKPGALTDEEWDVMRQHPVIAERIILSMPTLAHLAGAVRAEHERWDGGGYPDGLAGEAIPVPSRIVLVADAYQAMTSHRPYRPAMSSAEALEELRRNAGAQFWPDAVDAAFAVLGSPAQ